MRESLVLHRQLRESIQDEIARRIAAHQARIARLRTGQAALAAAGAPTVPDPLVMLAHGDSWFDYPLAGNSLSLDRHSTDIIAQLSALGMACPVVLNVSHFGDATTVEMSLPKQQRLIDVLQNRANWLTSGQPDAILFSGGGDDIAGNQFCVFLDYNIPGATGLNAKRFALALEMIKASYLDLFAFRDRYAPGTPIFGHCYDFPIPNGVHPDRAGPWLQPSLEFCRWNTAQGTKIVRDALVAFKSVLVGLASDPANNFTLVITQGVLGPDDWANELHPYPAGFKKIAAQFIGPLRARFPGRI